MRGVALNIATGALCYVNLTLAAAGTALWLFLKSNAQTIAALATATWFILQIVFALIDRYRRRRPRRPRD